MVDRITIVCLGNPAIIGDSVGPTLGTMLKDMGMNVIGTTEDPLTPSTLNDRLCEVREEHFVIVIDACVGNDGPYVRIIEGPTKPGGSYTDKYSEIGHMSIKCCTGATASDLLTTSEIVVTNLVSTVKTLVLYLLRQIKAKKGIYIEEIT